MTMKKAARISYLYIGLIDDDGVDVVNGG
jgi:hypothetical protein